MLALFRSEERLAEALAHLRGADITPLETYTPAPMSDEPADSPIPGVVLLTGLAGAAASLALQTYSSVVAYPFDIGNRALFAWPSFVPTIFENAVLAAIAAGFLAFLLINGMPRLYDPVDEAEMMREASGDGWIVAVRSGDADIIDRARDILDPLRPERIEELDE